MSITSLDLSNNAFTAEYTTSMCARGVCVHALCAHPIGSVMMLGCSFPLKVIKLSDNNFGKKGIAVRT
jgi:hypothetical protein